MKKRLQYGLAVSYISIPTLMALTLVALKTQKWESPATFFWIMLATLAVEAFAVIAIAAIRAERIDLFASRHQAFRMALMMPKRLAFAQLVPMLLTVLGIVIGQASR